MSNAQELDVYIRLALLWSDVVWGWLDHLPSTGVLQQILRGNLSEEEAKALSEIPLKPVPLDPIGLDEIAAKSSSPREKLEQILDGIVARGLLFHKDTADGRKGYALLRQSFGFNQVFLWKGDKTAHAQKMVQLQRDQEFTKATNDFFTTVDTKAFRYIPTTEAIDPQWQNVYPSETIENVIKKASKLALAHCPCRVRYEMVKGQSCGHSTDVCIKLNDLAECVIDAGLAKEITHEEALEVIKKADREGLVHFAYNTGEGMKHICNCCGHACWNVRPIRLRQVPRDMLMATYFLRETDEDECIACENCVDICPVDAVKIADGVAKVDQDWCIGCGVCVSRCSTGAIRLVEKEHKPNQSTDFFDLYTKIHSERVAVRKAKTEAGAL